jgi:hypothetical protein
MKAAPIPREIAERFTVAALDGEDERFSTVRVSEPR